jgi:hypothetical protein
MVATALSCWSSAHSRVLRDVEAASDAEAIAKSARIQAAARAVGATKPNFTMKVRTKARTGRSASSLTREVAATLGTMRRISR